MTEIEIKQHLRYLIEVTSDFYDVLPVAFLVDGVLAADPDDQLFLARFYVQRTAQILAGVQSGVYVDPEVEREVCAHFDGELQSRPEADIRVSSLVKSIFSAHSVRCPEFEDLFVDPEWLISNAVAGLKQLLQEVCAENAGPGECQYAYIIRRGGEDFVVPCLELTDAELAAVSKGWL